jgi:hypothetical protein
LHESDLLGILARLCQEARVARLNFNDGEAYDLRIYSTMHAEEGGDVIAQVIRVGDEPILGKFPEGEHINFLLADVVHVSVAGECVFSTLSD